MNLVVAEMDAVDDGVNLTVKRLSIHFQDGWCYPEVTNSDSVGRKSKSDINQVSH